MYWTPILQYSGHGEYSGEQDWQRPRSYKAYILMVKMDNTDRYLTSGNDIDADKNKGGKGNEEWWLGALLDREVRVKGVWVESWITQRNIRGLVLGAENIKIHETRSLLTHIMKRPTCQVTIIAF